MHKPRIEWEKCGESERAQAEDFLETERTIAAASEREKLNEVRGGMRKAGGSGGTFKVIKTIDLNLVLFSFSRQLNRLS